MIDMRPTTTPKSDQTNADDFIGGEKRTVKITGVQVVENTDQPTLIHYEGDKGKPWKPCLTMRRVLVNVWGYNGEDYIGKHLTLFCDPSVTFGRDAVGGVRVSHMEGIDQKQVMMMTASKGKKKPYIVEPLIMEQHPTLNPFTREEYVMLEEALNNAQNMDELKDAFGNVNAARGRMGDDDMAALTAIKDTVKNNLSTPKKEENNDA